MRSGGLGAARTRAVWVHRAATVAAFVAIYLILVKVLHLNLIFSRTTAAGGDMGSHHYIDTFLREHLLPHGKVTGWATGWFAGIPMLTFYFPLPYTLIAALTPLVGNQIAFKAVSASGLFALPLTCWGAFRVLRLPEPAPLLAAAASVPFLFMTSYTIYGGNIASTMAGEFPFALSFSLLPLTLALLWRLVEEGTGWRVTTLLVAAVVLSHILTTIVLVLGAVILVLRPGLRATGVALGQVARVLAVGFCLTAFWALPFILRIQYTAHFKWTQLSSFGVLFPPEIRPYLVLTAVGVVAAVARGERRILLYAWPAAVAVCLFAFLARFAPKAPLWNARMLPFIYLFSLLVAAYGAAVVAARLTRLLQRGSGMHVRAAWLVVVAVLVAAPLYGSWRHRAFMPGWSQYNYEGFEVKPGWPQAQALFSTLQGLPKGRVMWEFSRDYESFGTTRTLENIPVFAGQDTMEGLLIESSLNAPFHFITQAETSETQTQAVPGIDYPGFDFEMGLRHLRMYGVRWYVAYTDRAKQAAKAAGLPVRATSGKFTIYEVGDGHLVEVPRFRPVLLDDPDWRSNSLSWYRNRDWLDTPLAYASAGDPAARAAFAQPGRLPVTTLPRQALTRPGTVPSRDDGDTLEFTTDRVGEPHVVKVSYFPNWRAEGAKGPWMLSPGLMVVVPTQAKVRLVYRDTAVETAGKALTLLGVGFLVVPPLAGRLRRRTAARP
ncbi:MAG TPA: 6-pyruvoyl-tetrahydropterin synthase-related protein [Actinomycetes bacterium]|nr:6-pyruvoyl-tetrahydropterin synthase-related protein [Actinomycetes bacterium]